MASTGKIIMGSSPCTATHPEASACIFQYLAVAVRTPYCFRSITVEGMGPSFAVEGATTTRVFETYIEEVLVPSLRTRQIVLMNSVDEQREHP